MKKEELEKLLFDIICTSKLESGFNNSRPSFEFAAYVYTEIDDFFNDKKNQFLKSFDGYDSKHVEELLNSMDRVKIIIEQIVEKLENFKPSINISSSYRVRIENIDSKIFQSYCKAFNKSISKEHRKSVSVIDIPDDELYTLKKLLNTLAKALIKLDALQIVIEEIELEDRYKFKKEFESVPEACRFYEEISDQEVTRDNLKKWFQQKVTIHEKGEEVSWEIIDKRINSWVGHQNKMPNRKPISHK